MKTIIFFRGACKEIAIEVVNGQVNIAKEEIVLNSERNEVLKLIRKTECEDTSKEIFFQFLKEKFKALGFSKNKKIWTKETNNKRYQFEFQNSTLGKEIFYLIIHKYDLSRHNPYESDLPYCIGHKRIEYGLTMQDTFDKIITGFEQF